MTMLSKITFLETKPSKGAVRLFTIDFIFPTLFLTMKFQKKTRKICIVLMQSEHECDIMFYEKINSHIYGENN